MEVLVEEFLISMGKSVVGSTCGISKVVFCEDVLIYRLAVWTYRGKPHLAVCRVAELPDVRSDVTGEAGNFQLIPSHSAPFQSARLAIKKDIGVGYTILPIERAEVAVPLDEDVVVKDDGDKQYSFLALRTRQFKRPCHGLPPL
jgi:hypothetical protein